MWGDSVHSQAFPELFSFSRAQATTICKATAIEDLALLFNLPISEEAYGQLLLFAAEFDSLQISEEDDVWTYNFIDKGLQNPAYTSEMYTANYYKAFLEKDTEPKS
jgi:hypothetical protein